MTSILGRTLFLLSSCEVITADAVPEVNPFQISYLQWGLYCANGTGGHILLQDMDTFRPVLFMARLSTV